MARNVPRVVQLEFMFKVLSVLLATCARLAANEPLAPLTLAWEAPPSGTKPPHGVAPAHLNCTAKRFIDSMLQGVHRQLRLAGVTDVPATSLALHFDAGRSQPEGGGRNIVGLVTHINASAADPKAAGAAASNCTAEQVRACAEAAGGLASLEGLGSYLVQALENGVARPTPAKTGGLGFGPVANAMLKGRRRRESGHQATSFHDAARHIEPGFLELGGGSGAGTQIICDGKALASVGGGGGGGAAGMMGSSLNVGEIHRLKPNETAGGGGGGGMQMFFPASLKESPWAAQKWLSWSSGGGSGCGTCKKTDPKCSVSQHGITCGAKMDETGAVNRTLGRHVADLWRKGVLRQCYDAGKLAIIGGGGGGSGGSGCCKSVPSLNFGFGFRAEFKPPVSQAEIPSTANAENGNACCPDLARWNITSAGESASGSGTIDVVSRRLSLFDVHSHDQVQQLTRADVVDRSQAERNITQKHTMDHVHFHDDVQQLMPFSSQPSEHIANNDTIDPFAMENSGRENPNNTNRMPNLKEMISQHAKRIGVDRSALLDRTTEPSCALPAWLNGSNFSEIIPNLTEVDPKGSHTKEPEAALKYIVKFNPLQGYLAEGASKCGGWGDWCCLCHSAQWRIACLPDKERVHVAWFLTEDCCESKLQRNKSSPAYVVETTPERNKTVAWQPQTGWVKVPSGANDSYDWNDVADVTDGSFANPAECVMIDTEATDTTQQPSTIFQRPVGGKFELEDHLAPLLAAVKDPVADLKEQEALRAHMIPRDSSPEDINTVSDWQTKDDRPASGQVYSAPFDDSFHTRAVSQFITTTHIPSGLRPASDIPVFAAGWVGLACVTIIIAWMITPRGNKDISIGSVSGQRVANGQLDATDGYVELC